MGDSTLDFGFVTKTYAIGDVVWIDANNNGLQDDDEDPLAGVTVELLVDGTVVATTTTDEVGRYVFDNREAGTYQVRFTLTDKQAAHYEFTQQDAGDDALDSDADPATGFTITIVLDDSNTNLTGEYEHRTIEASQGIDPTWDAGVVLKPTPEKVPGQKEPGDQDKPTGLPDTGAPMGLGAVLGAMVLLAAGGALLLIRRRQA